MSSANDVNEPLPVAAMSSRQLIRRARLIETVQDVVREVGPNAVQMRDVAERSGIALGTAYRYFASKEHLLSAAVSEWQERQSRRAMTAQSSTAAGRRSLAQRVEGYVERELKAFQRHPEMAALMVQMSVWGDPYAGEAIDRMIAANASVFATLLDDVAPVYRADIERVLEAVLFHGLMEWVTRRSSFAEMSRQVLSATALLMTGLEAHVIESRSGSAG